MIREMTDGEWDEAADQFYAGKPADAVGECDGCGCSQWACEAYRTAGKVCCPDCSHCKKPALGKGSPV